GRSSPSRRSAAKPSTGKAPTATPASPPGVHAIALAADDAKTYDPYRRPGAEFGPARNAVDGDPGSVWDVTTPADGEALRTGLVLDLGAAYALDSLRVTTPTSGFDMELYGARDKALPGDILDKRWEHLTDVKTVGDGQTIALKGRSSHRFRLVVLWFTKAANVADPRVAIGNVSVRGGR
ncbi:MAG: discoidin domain-containing protein, partial [Actinomycetota bacterium]|nr:discoidin domain-containing protein [Actinomycetota bacterium]